MEVGALGVPLFSVLSLQLGLLSLFPPGAIDFVVGTHFLACFSPSFQLTHFDFSTLFTTNFCHWQPQDTLLLLLPACAPRVPAGRQ